MYNNCYNMPFILLSLSLVNYYSNNNKTVSYILSIFELGSYLILYFFVYFYSYLEMHIL